MVELDQEDLVESVLLICPQKTTQENSAYRWSFWIAALVSPFAFVDVRHHIVRLISSHIVSFICDNIVIKSIIL